MPSFWDDLRRQTYLGKEEFVKIIQQLVQSDENISEIPRAQRRAKAKPLSYYSSFNDRNAGIAAAYQTGSDTQKTIADEFGLHYATASRIVKKAEYGVAHPNPPLSSALCARLIDESNSIQKKGI